MSIQALFYQLRTTREEMSIMKKRLAAVQAVDPTRQADPDHPMQDATAGGEAVNTSDVSPSRLGADGIPNTTTSANGTYNARQPWDVVDEVVKILKTAFPLLILCLESMVEQIGQRFKGTQEEDGYRLVCMLMQDGISVRTRAPQCATDRRG
jgi:transformation/transcription domain-associated protein